MELAGFSGNSFNILAIGTSEKGLPGYTIRSDKEYASLNIVLPKNYAVWPYQGPGNTYGRIKGHNFQTQIAIVVKCQSD